MRLRKEKGNIPIGVLFISITFMLMFSVAFTVLSIARLMTHQHEIDDALADASLASLVLDPNMYKNDDVVITVGSFDGIEEDNSGNIRDVKAVSLQNVDGSYEKFKTSINEAIMHSDAGFYRDFTYVDTIFYEVKLKSNFTLANYKLWKDLTDEEKYEITGTSFGKDGGKLITTEPYGTVSTPDGQAVKETSVYAKVSFKVSTYFKNQPEVVKTKKIYSVLHQSHYDPDHK